MTKQQRRKLSISMAKTILLEEWHKYNTINFQGSLTREPKFSIVDTKKFLAAYKFKIKRKKVVEGEIIFSLKLFRNAPKKVFVDAFLHEMAHQFCAEELNIPFQSHGNIWKLICKACGANPSKSSPWL